jgi:mannose-1-phosphate guanylyltransferase
VPALQAVLLIGGFGTRLRPMTDRLPKSMVPVLNVPAIEHTIAYLKRFGIRDIILTLNYLPDIIRDRLGDGERYGVNLVYCMEEEPLGTAGAVKNTEAFLNGGTFAVLNGDVFADLDIGAMLDEHRAHKAAATIALHQVEDPSAFGVVEQTGDGRVAAFVEKPKREEARSNWINAGTYLLEPEVLRYAPAGEKYMFENGLFPALLDKGERFYGFRDAGYWLDMGRPETYYQLNADLLAGAYKSPATPVVAGLQCAPGVTIPASTSISGNVVIAGGCRIGERAEITGPCAIGPECTIGDGARVTGGILWDGVNIGDGARVEYSILCSGVSIKRGATAKDLVRTVDAERPLEGAR